MNQHIYKTEPLITLDNIALRVYDRLMFQGTSWTIRGDEQWVIIGPNGSGKSTLMRALCGQVPVVQGRVVYCFPGNGQQIVEHENLLNPLNLLTKNAQDAIAYVAFEAQGSVLGYEDPYYQMRWNSVKGRGTLTVSEYLSEQHIYKRNPYEVVEMHHDPAVFAARREQVVDLLGIAGLLDRNLVSISNGERRKVQIAQALLKQPQLFILDNPFDGLDQDFRKRFRTIVKDLMQDSMRVIVVATDVEDIPEGITHVLAVDGGAVVAQEAISDFTKGTWQADRPDPLKSVQSVDTTSSVASPVIEMRNVTITYDAVRVLDNITWTVREGERWALLGPNGAGKTTLLSLILGDNPQAYANDITLFGRRRGSGESIWDIKQRIGWAAPELHMYYPRHVSCFDVVCSGFFDAIGRYRRCTAEQHETARTWMQRLGIAYLAGDHSEARFGTLSEGEQRLVLLARALVKAPELLVLDEPCQGLDTQNRTRVIKIVETIGQHLNVTLIYVTHEWETLPETITHRMQLNEGKIVKEGSRE